MQSNKDRHSFELFRFQLLPATRHFQKELFSEVDSIEEIVRRKNEFFGRILEQPPKLMYRNYDLRQKILLSSPEWLIGRIGTQKLLKRDKPNFEAEFIEDWPNVSFLINNDPLVQTIAISKNMRAFSSPSVVVQILKAALEPLLMRFQLTIQVEARFEKESFWTLVDRHEGRLTSVRFELVSPNMSNISKGLKVDLKQLSVDTNAQKTNFEIQSEPQTVLEIKRDNVLIDSLVDYSSEGGGDISIRVKGYRRRIHTSKAVKEVEIDDLIITAKQDTALDALRKLIE